MPTPFEGLLWGTLPIGSSILAIFLLIVLPDRRRTHVNNVLTISATPEPVYAREVQP
jgi:hypothetical protein